MLMLSLFIFFFSLMFFFFLSRQVESTQGWMLNPSLHLDHLKQNTQQINSLTPHILKNNRQYVKYKHQSMQNQRNKKLVIHAKKGPIAWELQCHGNFRLLYKQSIIQNPSICDRCCLCTKFLNKTAIIMQYVHTH